MRLEKNGLRVVAKALLLLHLCSCSGGMLEGQEPGTDDGTTGGTGNASATGLGGAVTLPRGGATATDLVGSTGGYAATTLPGVGGAAADYRCTTPPNVGAACPYITDRATTPRVAYNPLVGECVATNFYACGDSTQTASFSTMGGCEAVCQGAGSVSSCDWNKPETGASCLHETATCIYRSRPGEPHCLCNDFNCSSKVCSTIHPLVNLPTGSCKDGICVAESPIVLVTSTTSVCDCTQGLWQCEDFVKYGGGGQ